MSDRKAVDNLKSRYQKLVAKLGPLSSRPRWITELGFPSAVVQGQRPKTQEKRLELAYLKFGDTPNVRAFIVHRLEDEGDANKQFGVLEENVEESVTCKPIYIRLATLRDTEDRVACP